MRPRLNDKIFRTTFLCVAIAFPVLLLLQAGGNHHVFMVISHYLKGRAGNCTLAESFEGEALWRLQVASMDEMMSASKLVRKDRGFSLWSTPAGEYWVPTRADGGIAYDLGEQKRNIYGTGIRRGDIVLDCGANVGVYTRKALWAGASKVIAIEPAAENLECLRRNFSSEIADGRVVLYPKGVWDKDDILKFAVDPTNSARDTFVRTLENAQFVQMPVTSIDNLVAELRLSKVDFIKMDIEGAEQKAVAGAKSTIARFKPRMALSIYHITGDEVEVPKLVTHIAPGYKVTKTCLCVNTGIQPEVAFFN